MVDRGKRCKTMNDVKSVKNINTSPRSFLGLHHIQNEDPLSHKLEDQY